MRIFSTKGTKLVEIVEEQFPLEREVQRLTEVNLQELFDLVLIKSEFELHGLRIDTLAFDKESGAFVIIEYKRDRNFSVVDQGVAYLNLMLNNKADFILEYLHAFPSQRMNKQDVDWSQSRIIFMAPEFTRHQQYAIGFKDLGIQLWEVHKYSNGLLVIGGIEQAFKITLVKFIDSTLNLFLFFCFFYFHLRKNFSPNYFLYSVIKFWPVF